jgi:hypothetical protein
MGTHQPVNIAVIGHVERSARARRDGNAEQRREGGKRVDMSRRHDNPRQPGEHHQGHDARLQQREKVPDSGDPDIGKGFGNRHSQNVLMDMRQFVELMERRR